MFARCAVAASAVGARACSVCAALRAGFVVLCGVCVHGSLPHGRIRTLSGVCGMWLSVRCVYQRATTTRHAAARIMHARGGTHPREQQR